MKKPLFLVAVLLMAICLTAPAFAAPDVRPGEAVNGGAVASDEPGGHHTGPADPPRPGTPGISDKVEDVTNELIDTNVTTQDIVDRLNTKGNDVVVILQTVGKGICVAGFVVSCILAVIGSVGNRRLLAGACIGMLVSGVAYAGIVCGREIVVWIANWASS